MPSVDFLISNDRHHVGIMEPVVRELQGRYECGVVSLCEFRGLRTPEERFARLGVGVRRLSARVRRSSAGGGQGSKGGTSRARAFARRVSWRLMLARNVERWLETRPDAVVLANDAAFPYDLIVGELKRRKIRFVLVQEGIRFPLPSEQDATRYGQGGAAAIAAWGEASGEYFRSAGAEAERIALTGSPKFDGVLGKDYRGEAERLRGELGLRGKTLTVLSNPIDDQGFCTTREKIGLLRRFAEEVAPLFEDEDFRLVYKLHGREDARAPEEALGGAAGGGNGPLPYRGRIVVTKDAPLYPLFYVTKAAVILASTVGLEALLFGVPLGVLEIPGFGFVYDYVSSGAARGLGWGDRQASPAGQKEPPGLPLVERVCALLRMERGGPAGNEYVARQLATREGAAKRVGEVIASVVERDAKSSSD